jgi:hypothetical protein
LDSIAKAKALDSKSKVKALDSKPRVLEFKALALIKRVAHWVYYFLKLIVFILWAYILFIAHFSDEVILKNDGIVGCVPRTRKGTGNRE